MDVITYSTTYYRLSAVSVGDTVSMKVSGDEVTEININEQVDMVIDSIYSSSDWIRLEDSNGKTVSADLDEAEFYIDGSYTSDIDDFSIGDKVVATFAGRTLIKVEAVSQVKGEVTKVNTSAKTFNVKTASGDTRTVTFSSNSAIVKNGSSYSSLNNLNVGDRVIVGGSASSKTITVMKSRTADVRYATSGLIQFLADAQGDSYKLVNGCYCHYKNSTSQFSASTLTRNDNVTIYYTAQDSVYEVVKN